MYTLKNMVFYRDGKPVSHAELLRVLNAKAELAKMKEILRGETS